MWNPREKLIEFHPKTNVSPKTAKILQNDFYFLTFNSRFQIKEKSERSLGMAVAQTRASMDAGYDNETFTGFTRRQSGIPGSRNGSRPPSRTGSNLSLDSDPEYRGGVRRTSSMRSGGSSGRPPYRQTPVGFGSSTPRKTSTPLGNGAKRTPSNSSTDRTPMAGR